MEITSNLDVALSYNTKGFSVIPVRPREKAPMYLGWQKYSTTRSTKEEIEQWWKATPNANIGVALGPANGTDGRYLFVVDQDVLKDENKAPIFTEDGSFKQKGDIRGCPTTVSQTTGSGGKQFFYWAPKGYVVGNSKPRPLIDIKGFAGQVLVPPSVHPNGNNYAWDFEELLPENIAEFPQDALDALLGERASSKSSMQTVLGGVPVGLGMRHIAIAQAAGFYIGRARTPEEIEMARIALYAWDKEKNHSPEPWEERKRELDNTFASILAKELAKPVHATSHQLIAIKPKTSIAIYKTFSNIQTQPIQWLWPERFALGKLSMIVGDPDVGKSLLTLAIASVVSKGCEWPVDNTRSPIGDVIILSAEDDAGDTTKPRLEAAGADTARVHTLQAIRDENVDGSKTERMFSLKRDLVALEEMLLVFPESKLVIIDPISAYLDDTDSHRNAAVRGLLGPLAALASKHMVAIVVIDHLNKNSNERNTLYRPGGSLAFVAAARAAYLVTKDTEKPERRLMMPIKNNIAKANTGLAYTIVIANNGAPVIAWEPEPILVTTEEILARLDSAEDRTNTDWAVLFLEDLLASGPKSSVVVYKEALKERIKDKTLRRAGDKLGIKPRKTSFGGGWVWALPGHEDAHVSEDAPLKDMGILEVEGHLRSEDEEISNDEIPF